eukprot:GEMP01013154.1.p1 GENE.GEMP01013154.1~~GEMP01013154.1.p1  ORF type:complete len:579 (+),score=113.21 GEMP01013154.1:149-1885(+)
MEEKPPPEMIPETVTEFGHSMSQLATETKHRVSANFSFQRADSLNAMGPADGGRKGVNAQLVIMRSVVRIYTTSAARSYLLPWHVARQRDSTGTGFIISAKERLMMTNAHVVCNHNFIQVAQQDDARKFEAKVLCIAHDIDLALLTVLDEGFWKSVTSCATFTPDLPMLYSEVKAVGFPTGGSTICVTKGVVSRLDAQLYVHPRLCGIVPSATHNSGPIIIIQIDAAINPGNSGGPTFDASGYCCGIASSGQPGAQNVGYIIPSIIAMNFLHSYRETKRWPGVCEAGIQFRNLESQAMRAYFKLKEDMTGVQVRSISPLSSLAAKVNKGDVLLYCDGKRISNEGTVGIDASGQTVQLNFLSLITQKRIGEETTLQVLRRETGVVETVSVQCAPIPALMPRFDNFDCEPTYFICGGLVFSIISTPLKCEYFETQKNAGIYVPKESLVPALYNWKEDANHEVVCLLRGLKHSVNTGYDLNSLRVLHSFNKIIIKNLATLVLEAKKCKDDPENNPFMCFAFMAADDDSAGSLDDPDIVLNTKECATADEEMMVMHKIPALMSPNLSGKKRKSSKSSRKKSQ